MSKKGRIAAYGSASAMVAVGGIFAAVLAGVAGEVLAMALIGSGLVIVTGLVFMEVGLSEDRERERERGLKRGLEPTTPPPPAIPPRRLDLQPPPRLRGHRRER